jgi:response regulator RpfG family c-di-GMP phosphodiesterase
METKITNIKSAGIKKKNFKVLIIDDEPELLESVCELATLLGYDVLSADTVEKAESLIPKCHGILSDVNMPGKDKLSQSCTRAWTSSD